MKPHVQGDILTTCGLLASINAIRLALADTAPVSSVQSRELFAAGIKYLHKKKLLVNALTEGMEIRQGRALAQHLCRSASTSTVKVSIERPDHSDWRSIDQAFAWIESSIVDQKPVILSLMGALDHTTVVSGITPKTLRLFDSLNISHVRRSACSLRSDPCHQVPPKSLLRLAVQRSP